MAAVRHVGILAEDTPLAREEASFLFPGHLEERRIAYPLQRLVEQLDVSRRHAGVGRLVRLELALALGAGVLGGIPERHHVQRGRTGQQQQAQARHQPVIVLREEVLL